MNFSDFFKTFLERIKTKDISVVHETIDKTIPIRVLLPYGKPITDHNEFIKGQESYFKNPATHFDYQVISTEENGDLGFGVCLTQVRIPEVESFQEFKNQICFLFKKIDNKWILTFDQNTRLGSDQ